MNYQNDFSNLLFSKNDHTRVHSLLTVQIAFMAFMGQIPYVIRQLFPRVLRRLGRIFSNFYSAFVILQTLHTCILFLKTTLDMLKNGEMDDITDALTQVIINAFSCFSTCYWLWHIYTLRNFIDYINTNYWHHSLAGLTFVSSFEVYMKVRRISIYWYTAGIVGASLWGVTPLLQGSHTLPLKCWYPFDPLQPWVYPFIYFLQMLTQLNIGITYACGGATYASLIVLMLGQFDVLFCSLKNLHHHARLASGAKLNTMRQQQLQLPSPTEDEANQYLYCIEHLTNLSNFKELSENISMIPSFEVAFHNSLVKCVQHHQFICKSFKTIEKLYHPYCLVKSLQITFQLCLLVFVGVAGERSLMRVFNIFQYMALTFCDLFFFTYCGELLRQHSMRSGEAFLRTDWPSYLTVGKQDILIFLVNSHRSIKLTAGKLFIMDVGRLFSVVMQAFSFLTLLQNIAAKK